MKAKVLTEEQIEINARRLWDQREYFIQHTLGFKAKSWDEAVEPGRELMRKYARAGQTNWLEDLPSERDKH